MVPKNVEFHFAQTNRLAYRIRHERRRVESTHTRDTYFVRKSEAGRAQTIRHPVVFHRLQSVGVELLHAHFSDLACRRDEVVFEGPLYRRVYSHGFCFAHDYLLALVAV